MYKRERDDSLGKNKKIFSSEARFPINSALKIYQVYSSVLNYRLDTSKRTI